MTPYPSPNTPLPIPPHSFTPQQLLLLPALGFLQALGTPRAGGHPRWVLQAAPGAFHFPFFSTRFRLEPSLAADHD